MPDLFSYYLKFEPIHLKIVTDEVTLKLVSFVNETPNNFTESKNLPQIMTEAIEQLREYFNLKRETFNLELSPEGTEFQKRVWAILCQIPFGQTLNYQEMANKLGDPKVIRAAASANGKNPIAIIIPCHRVIGKNGELTGYSGGLSKKKFLLDLENKSKNGVLEMF